MSSTPNFLLTRDNFTITMEGVLINKNSHIIKPIISALKLQDEIGKIKAYIRILQDGDPENENPKKILDTIEHMLEETQQP